MFNKLSLLALAAPLAHALTLSIPQNPLSSESVTITWTSQPGDPSTFSLELTNDVFHKAFAIANNLIIEQGEVTLTLPSVPIGGGYTLEAVNISDINDVFASTGAFSIGQGASDSLAPTISNSAIVSSPSATTPVTKPPTLSGSGSNAVSTGASNSQGVNTVSGLSSGASNTASAVNSNTSSAAPLSGAALSTFGANKGVVAAALLSALAGAAVVAL